MATTLEFIRNYAKEHGLSIRFRNGKDNEFTIFIYDKSKSNKYIIGFDGSRTATTCDLEYCCNQAYRYIKFYNKLYNGNN